METIRVQPHRNVIRCFIRLSSAALLAGALTAAAPSPAATALPLRRQTADQGLTILLCSTAREAAWASIRYNPQAGMALIFSELYPVK